MSLHTGADLYVSRICSGTLKITFDSNTEVFNWGGADVEIYTYVREVQTEKASLLIVLQADRLPMSEREMQPEKAEAPIPVHEYRFTLVRDVQFWKAYETTVVQEDKSPTVDRAQQSEKA